jgi:hypothetical protein
MLQIFPLGQYDQHRNDRQILNHRQPDHHPTGQGGRRAGGYVADQQRQTQRAGGQVPQEAGNDDEHKIGRDAQRRGASF